MNQPAPGSQFVLIATVLRPAEQGDTIPDSNGSPITITRPHDKFWASTQGVPSPILCCACPDAQLAFDAATAIRGQFPDLFSRPEPHAPPQP